MPIRAFAVGDQCVSSLFDLVVRKPQHLHCGSTIVRTDYESLGKGARQQRRAFDRRSLHQGGYGLYRHLPANAGDVLQELDFLRCIASQPFEHERVDPILAYLEIADGIEVPVPFAIASVVA